MAATNTAKPSHSAPLIRLFDAMSRLHPSPEWATKSATKLNPLREKGSQRLVLRAGGLAGRAINLKSLDAGPQQAGAPTNLLPCRAPRRLCGQPRPQFQCAVLCFRRERRSLPRAHPAVSGSSNLSRGGMMPDSVGCAGPTTASTPVHQTDASPSSSHVFASSIFVLRRSKIV